MANKITKNVSDINPVSVATKAAKKAAVNQIDQQQKCKEGGSWPQCGFGTEEDAARKERQRNYAKADYIEPAERTIEDMLSGNPEEDPVKKPTMRNVGVVEPSKKYLGHFANDDVLKNGHNTMDGSQLSKIMPKGRVSYKGEGKGNT